jgi:hypothetical protein
MGAEMEFAIVPILIHPRCKLHYSMIGWKLHPQGC